MSIETLATGLRTTESTVPDSITELLVYDVFDKYFDQIIANILDSHNREQPPYNILPVRNRGIQFEGHPEVRLRVSVLELPEASSTLTGVTEDNGNKYENRVYDRNRINFLVIMTDGEQILELLVEGARSQHEGVGDCRYKDGNHHPEKETVTLTVLTEFFGGRRCHITFNHANGDGTVEFDQLDKPNPEGGHSIPVQSISGKIV